MLSDTITDRFWTKVNKQGPIVRTELGPCWVWTGAISTPQGYGSFKPQKHGRTYLAHRFAWSLINGPIPTGAHILHRCGNRLCVHHLYAGNRSDNMRDAAFDGTLRTVKLSPAQVMEIRRSFIPGNSYRLAKTYGVYPETIMAIVRGKTWKRLPLLSEAEEAQIGSTETAVA